MSISESRPADSVDFKQIWQENEVLRAKGGLLEDYHLP